MIVEPINEMLDNIISKMIEVINSSKDEILDITQSSKQECLRLEEEIRLLNSQIAEAGVNISKLEIELKDRKKKLVLVNKNFNKYSEAELREAYESADNIRVEVAVQKAQEQFLIKRRNDIEIRLKETQKVIQKAEKMSTQMSVAMNYMNNDMQALTSQIGDIQKKEMLALRIIQAQEEERKRVARDIHDGPAQLMSNIVLKVEICERLLEMDFNRAVSELKNLKQTARECLQDVRKVIYNLRPMSLDDLGLIPTIKRFIDKVQEDTSIQIILRSIGALDKINPTIALAVFRIVQESIYNIQKHAKASLVNINIEHTGKSLKMLIVDDGVGFNVKDQENHVRTDSGFGLVNMRERVQLLGGDFNIFSEHGKGTRLFVNIPMIDEEEA